MKEPPPNCQVIHAGEWNGLGGHNNSIFLNTSVNTSRSIPADWSGTLNCSPSLVIDLGCHSALHGLLPRLYYLLPTSHLALLGGQTMPASISCSQSQKNSSLDSHLALLGGQTMPASISCSQSQKNSSLDDKIGTTAWLAQLSSVLDTDKQYLHPLHSVFSMFVSKWASA